MSNFPSVSESEPGAIRFAIRVTLQDALAFDRCFRRSGEARALIGYVAAAGAVGAVLLGFGAMLAARVALAGSGCDLDESFDSNARLRMFLTAAGSILALEVLASAAFLWNRQRTLETTYRARRLKRHGIVASDPELAEPFLCAFDSAGFRFECPSLDFASLWMTARRLEETADHMFLFVSMARAFIIPKRDLPPAAILAVRDLARENGKAPPA